ncbi:hypothetical protein [Nevskia soli]|uniref:hypothetical protein n=1 Tax=Nevskia soli TaxID=418856 RepID=UPI0015D8FD7A|nr:hypothetical protein [Nevskia soli]
MTDEGLRADLRETRDELRAEIAGIKEEMGGFKEELSLRIEKAETNLITAFHSRASPMEMRQRGLKNVVSDFDDRLVILEQGVRKLEAVAAGIS